MSAGGMGGRGGSEVSSRARLSSAGPGVSAQIVKYAPCAGMQPINIVWTPRQSRMPPWFLHSRAATSIGVSGAAASTAVCPPRCAASGSVQCCGRACIIVLTVSTGNMTECSAKPANEPANACCAATTAQGA